jgi:uncharacterized protein YpmB
LQSGYGIVVLVIDLRLVNRVEPESAIQKIDKEQGTELMSATLGMYLRNPLWNVQSYPE